MVSASALERILKDAVLLLFLGARLARHGRRQAASVAAVGVRTLMAVPLVRRQAGVGGCAARRVQHVVNCSRAETGRHHLVQLHLLVCLLPSRVSMRAWHAVLVRLMR